MAFVGAPAGLSGGASLRPARGALSRRAPATRALRRAPPVVRAAPRRAAARRAPAMQAAEGDPTPFFEDAPVTGGGTLSSRDLAAGTAIIAFYPRDCTSGCTTVAKELTAMLGDITTMGAKVYGCSPDSLASHDNFIETEQLGFPLISDESGAVMEAFSAWKEHPTFGKVVNRSTFIIKDGKIASAMRGVSSGGHAANVFEALKAV